LAYFSALSAEDILDSDAVAVTFAHRVLASPLAALVPLFVALSCIGSLNGVFLLEFNISIL
jgi:L-type amino acid transporter 11